MNYFLNFVNGEISINTYRKPTAVVTDIDDIVSAYEDGRNEDLVADLTCWIKEFGGNLGDDNLERVIEGIFGLNMHDYPDLRDVQQG